MKAYRTLFVSRSSAEHIELNKALSDGWTVESVTAAPCRSEGGGQSWSLPVEPTVFVILSKLKARAS